MAGRIPEHIVEEIRNRADIVDVIGSYVPLSKRGNDFWACCPFHHEKTPSFKVSAVHQAYHCFGCKASGNVFKFVEQRENVDFPGALRLLAQRYSITIPETPRPARHGGAPDEAPEPGIRKDDLLGFLKDAAEWFRRQLRESVGQPARDYLRNRGLDEETVNKFGLGYAPDTWDSLLQWAARQGAGQDLVAAAGLAAGRDEEGAARRVYDRFRGRLMFPIHDDLGRVIGFSGRILTADKETAKYINTPETAVFHKGKILYGLHLARTAFRDAGAALICEGQLDVIACHRAGLRHAVAPQGTAFTPEQAQILKRYADSVILAFDADGAGQKAAWRGIELALDADLVPRVVPLPPGGDPDSVFRTGGAAALTAAMAGELDAFEFAARQAEARHAASGPDAKAKAALEVLSLFTHIANPVRRAARCQWLAGRFSLPERSLLDELQRLLNADRRGAHLRETPGNRAADNRQAGAAMPAAPPFPEAADPVQRAEMELLDLAANFGFIAHELAERLPPECVSDTSIGQALNLLVGMAAQGEWELARKQLVANDAGNSAEVIRAMMDSRYSRFDLEGKDERERRELEKPLLQAMQDCLRRLRAEQLRRQLGKIQAELAAATPEAVRPLLARFQKVSQELAKLPKTDDLILTND